MPVLGRFYVVGQYTPRQLKTLKRHNKTDAAPKERDSKGVYQWEATVGYWAYDDKAGFTEEQAFERNLNYMSYVASMLRKKMLAEPSRWYRFRIAQLNFGYRTADGGTVVTQNCAARLFGPWCPEKGIEPVWEEYEHDGRTYLLLPFNLPDNAPYPKREGLPTLGEEDFYDYSQEADGGGAPAGDEGVEPEGDIPAAGGTVVAVDAAGNTIEFEVL